MALPESLFVSLVYTDASTNIFFLNKTAHKYKPRER